MRWYGQSRYNGGFGDPLDKVLWGFVDTTKCGYAVECGAGDGIWLSSTKVFEDHGWDCLNIEACPSTFEQLVKNRPLAKNVNYALWDVPNIPMSLDEYEESGLNGLSNLEKHPMMYSHNPTGQSIVTTIRWINIVDRPVDLFVLDVEGAELQAIKGMETTHFWPTVMCVEHTHVGMNVLNKTLAQYKYTLKWEDGLNGIWTR